VKALKQEAAEVAARVLREFPQDPNSHALKGSVCYFHGDMAGAERSWQKCLELDPRSAGAYGGISLVAWERGQFEKVVAVCRRALKLNPNMPGAHIPLGRSLMALGRTGESIAVMQQAVNLSPKSSDAHFYLGQAYMQLKEYGQAQESFRRCIRVKPSHAQAHYGLATASARLGQRDQAKQYQEKFRRLRAAEMEALEALRRSPSTVSGLAQERAKTAKAYTGAAGIYRSHGNVQQAEHLWQKAAIIDPKNTVCRAALMALYRRGNRLADALAFCKKLTQLQPKNTVNYVHLGDVYFRQRRYDEAEQAYQKIVELGPDKPEGYLALVYLHLRTGRKLPEAKVLASKVIELKPTPRHYFLLATVCSRSGDRASALAAVERALKMDPDNAQCRRLRELLRKER